MKKVRSILASLGVAAAAVAGVGVVDVATAPEAAAVTAPNGTIRQVVQSGSWSPVWTQMENIYTHTVYGLNVNPGITAGEANGYNVQHTTSEPQGFYTGPGWCTTYRFNNGPDYYAQGRSTGTWVSTHPGPGYQGTWTVYVASWWGSWCPPA